MVIFEEATFDSFKYYIKDLSLQSSKFIIAVCNDCSKVRIIRRYAYYDLCRSCSHKGNTSGSGNKSKNHTEETKAKIGKGNKGKTYTEEHRAKQSAALKGEKSPLFGKYGKAHPRYRGGKKLTNARTRAKRRELGCTYLIPLKDGEVGHHITNEYVIGIPGDIHKKFGGRRKKHRKLVLKWLQANDRKKYEIALRALDIKSLSWYMSF